MKESIILNDSEIEYLDVVKFERHMEDIGKSSSSMNLSEDIFRGEANVIGLESIQELSKEIHEVFEVSNAYKTHVNSGVIPLLNDVKDNITTVAKDAIHNMSLLK